MNITKAEARANLRTCPGQLKRLHAEDAMYAIGYRFVRQGGGDHHRPKPTDFDSRYLRCEGCGLLSKAEAAA